MSNIVSLRNNQTQLIQSRMTKRELNSIINNTMKYLSTLNVDVITALQLLRANEKISRQKFEELLDVFDKIPGRRDRAIRLLQEVTALMSFKEIVNFLRNVGLKQFANAIWTHCYGDLMCFQVECGMGVSLRTLEYFNDLKTRMDNGEYPDRLKELEGRADRLRLAIPAERILWRKQELVNRYDLVIYQMTAQHRKKTARTYLLQEMQDFLNGAANDVNLTLTRIVYCSKMAVTAIHDRDVATATRFIAEAHELISCSLTRESTWVKALVCHDHQYISRCLDSIAQSEEHLRNTCTEGLYGMNVMSIYSDNNADILVKIFLTEMAMGLLKISIDFEVDITKSVCEYDKREAERFLNSLLQRCTGQIEIRREMIINLCRARICEDTDLKLALSYARRAVELAPIGTHFPNQIENVKRYHTHLQNKTLRKLVT